MEKNSERVNNNNNDNDNDNAKDRWDTILTMRKVLRENPMLSDAFKRPKPPPNEK